MSKPDTVSVTIDGKTARVPAGATLLEAARSMGVEIPTMCFDPRLQPFGACRLCVVAIKSMRGRLNTACSTPVAEGMEVQTNTAAIDGVRRLAIELMLLNHPLDCPVCDKGGECALQDLAFKYGSSHNRFSDLQTLSDLPPETRSPLVERVPDRCILCGMCARVCDEVQCVGEIAFTRRGFTTAVSTLFDRPLDCQFCGQCIDACPVGALLAKPFKHRARVWELDHTHSICNWCAVGCRVRLDHKRERVLRVKAELGAGVNLGNLCGKGRYGFDFRDNAQRLLHPLIRRDGVLERATWDEALDRAAAMLERSIQAHGPAGAGLIAGPRAANEALFAARELFVRLLGSPNVGGQQEDLAAPLCDGVKRVLGAGSTAVYSDVFAADAILCVQADCLNSAPVLGNRIIARSREEDVRLIVIDSRLTREMAKAGHRLLCRAGTADLVLEALLALALDQGLLRLDDSAAPLRRALGDPAAKAAQAGVELDEINAAAAALCAARSKLIVLGPEPYRREQSRRTALLAADLALLAGAGVLSVLEKSNLRGAVELGLLPGEAGRGYGAMLEQAGSAIRTLLVLGDDPWTHAPGGRTARQGLERLDGLIVLDLFHNRTTQHAHVVLPAAAFSEQAGTITNGEGRVQALAAAVRPPGEARPDWAIILELGRRLGWPGAPANLSQLHAAMFQAEPWTGATIPPGGEAVELAAPPAARGLQIPQPRAEIKPNAQFPLELITGPLLWHSGTTSMRSKHLEQVCLEPRARLDLELAESMGIKQGDKLRISGPDWSIEAKADPGDFAPPGTVFLPDHFSAAPAAGFFKNGAAHVRMEKLGADE